MFTLLCCFAVAGAQVDLPLEPATQVANVGDVVEIDLVARADAFVEFSGIDAIFSWDPAKLEFIEALPGSYSSWILEGFPDYFYGINDDLYDGESQYTVLGPVTPPFASVPPDIVVTTLRFRVHGPGSLSLLPSSGQFALTQVLGLTPGQTVTGDISQSAAIVVAGSPVPAVPAWGQGLLVVVLAVAGLAVLRRGAQ